MAAALAARQRVEEIHGGLFAFEVIGHPVAIDEVGYNSTGGREERRRLS